MAADVKIDIAAEFTGKKAFKQADTATQKLTSNVKKLAGAVGLAYGTSAIIAYPFYLYLLHLLCQRLTSGLLLLQIIAFNTALFLTQPQPNTPTG